MEKKPKAITIIGWIELLLGIAGIRLFIGSFHHFTYYYFLTHSGVWLPTKSHYVTAGIDKLFSIFTFPFIFLFMSGILNLKYSPIARRFNVIWTPLSLIIVGLYFIRPLLLSGDTRPYDIWGWCIGVIFPVIYIILALSSIWFFTRPKVKERFE